jgi:hypothetical protein
MTKNRLPWLLAIACLMFAVLARGPAAAQQKAPETVVKWEYKILDFKEDPAEAEKNLNKLGDDGWELAWNVSKVSGVTFPEAPRAGRNDPGRIDTANYLVLKRAKR